MKKRFDTSEYSKYDNRPLPIRENKKGDRPDERSAWWKYYDKVCCLKGEDICVYAYRKVDKEME